MPVTEKQQIANTWGQLEANGGGVAIVKSWGGIRERSVDGWLVIRISAAGGEIRTDQKAAWYHYGRKWFGHKNRAVSHAEAQRLALAEAVAWVKAQGWYDGPWVGNRQGDKVPAHVNKQFPIRRR